MWREPSEPRSWLARKLKMITSEPSRAEPDFVLGSARSWLARLARENIVTYILIEFTKKSLVLYATKIVLHPLYQLLYISSLYLQVKRVMTPKTDMPLDVISRMKKAASKKVISRKGKGKSVSIEKR